MKLLVVFCKKGWNKNALWDHIKSRISLRCFHPLKYVTRLDDLFILILSPVWPQGGMGFVESAEKTHLSPTVREEWGVLTIAGGGEKRYCVPIPLVIFIFTNQGGSCVFCFVISFECHQQIANAALGRSKASTAPSWSFYFPFTVIVQPQWE